MININPATLITHLVFFVIMVMILNQLLLKPLLRVMDERQARVQGNRHAAEKASTKAADLMAEYDRQLEAARKQAVQEKDALRAAADAEQEKIIIAAREKAGDLIAGLRERIAAEYQQARDRLTADSRALGREIAGRLLGRPV